MNWRTFAFVCVVLAGFTGPAWCAESGVGKSDETIARNRASHAASDPQEVPPGTFGKAGIDRFSVRSENIREFMRTDGTVIVELNGEGMEKMVLDESSAIPRAVCDSAIERAIAKPGFAPNDFRGTVHSREALREYR